MGADTPVVVVAVVEDDVKDNDGIDDESFVAMVADGAMWTPTMFPSCIIVGDGIELPFLENFVGVVGSCWIIVAVFFLSFPLCGSRFNQLWYLVEVYVLIRLFFIRYVYRGTSLYIYIHIYLYLHIQSSLLFSLSH